MILPIYTYGQSVLRKETEEIDGNYENIGQLIRDMFETLRNADGVGLAAPQVGLPIRLMVVDLDIISDDMPEFKGYLKAYINPYIEEIGDETSTFEEGCLSFPGIHEKVVRPSRVRVSWMDESFQQHDEWFEGFPARVMQHEIDHLNGKCFIDRMSPLRRQMNKKALNSIAAGKFDCDYKVKTLKK
ncbi:MAG TPA: peptide deformylase [Bacteroidaceae bacterium]|jgi:peptide deformylase|nr:peptide deformylase [Bacteroidaceae bacterium]NLA94646.1 peptide deformylase [Bacteroidales bacterium]OPZ46010.1 MAG: Peptide deformylase [Bacteroidetes bacterium ADurb.BinA104]MBP8603117.1 peptide deformylase [Bacteroidaceae bacterium]HBA13395.1 peptide deformylase [Bacteroidales bacterium]